MDTETYVMVAEITEDNRDDLVKLALSMYLGEQCKYCGRTYETLEDLQDTVFVGYHDHGRLACGTCWATNNPAPSNTASNRPPELTGLWDSAADSDR